MEDCTGDNTLQKENDLYYFESDHLALRGNKDYSELLKTLFILSAQRERAFKDYEIVKEMKRSALEEPDSFLMKLKQNELEIPPIQTVAQIPFIDWYVYDTKIPEDELKAIYSDKSTERKENLDLHKHSNKSTHKKLWTSEEQKLLEELLIKYPEEPIESRRHRKIANELKTRTEKQVASRLQKYYQKMAKAGLPVNGKVSKSNFSKRNKHLHNKWRPSTFFPEYNVSVYMDETESVPGPTTDHIPKPSTSNYLFPTDYHFSENKEPKTGKSEFDMQVELLKRVKVEKGKELERGERFRHTNFTCDYCNEDPILGTRWHCSTCIQESVDFCTDCLVSQMYSEFPHPITHRFETLPVQDNADLNMSSDSDSDSTNENSNNISDSDTSAHSSVPSVQLRQTSHSNDYFCEKNFANGKKNDIMHASTQDFYEDNDKSSASYSTSDIGYAYLHSNLSMND